MSWTENTPRGDLLPVDERPRFQGNWQYIRAEMRDDHFWNEDSDRDGHHKKVEMTNLTDAIGSGNVDANGDPNNLSTDMAGMLYMRPKTSTEAPDAGAQSTQPFYMQTVSGTDHFLQLGIRSMALVAFDGSIIVNNSGNPWDYQHNISNVTYAADVFTVTFTTPLPTTNYVVLLSFNGTAAGVFPAGKIITKATGNFTFGVDNADRLRAVNLIVLGG